MNMLIREATSADKDAISELTIPLSEKYILPEFSNNIAELFVGSLTPEGIECNIRNDFRYHVALLDDQIIGVVGVKYNQHLYHLFVAEEHHRKGIARELWNTARAACIEAGNKEGFTVSASKYAKVVYEKLGFIAESGPQRRNGIVIIPMKLILNQQSCLSAKQLG